MANGQTYFRGAVLGVVLCFLAGAFFPVQAQQSFLNKLKKKPRPIPVFKPGQMREDLQIFRQSLSEAHPGLFQYLLAAAFKAKTDSISARLNQPLTEAQFFAVLQTLVVQIRSRETRLLAPKGGLPFEHFYTDSLFPLEPYFINDKAFVKYNFSDSVIIPRHAEIIMLDGMPVSAVQQKLLPLVAETDGTIWDPKRQQLGQNFSGYYALLTAPKPSYKITYRSLAGETETATVPGVRLAQIQALKRREAAFSALPELSLRFEEKQVAVLRLPTFMPDKKLQDAGGFLDRAFTQLKTSEVPNLVIDLRNNAAGTDKMGSLLYRYIASGSFRFYRQITTNTNKQFTFLKHGRVGWNFFFYRRLLKQNPDSSFRYSYHANLKEQAPFPQAFTGNVYLLQNNQTAGAAHEFAAIAFSNRRAILIGQETPENGAVRFGGKFVTVKLPHSKFELKIPLWQIELNVQPGFESNQGVKPQHAITPELTDMPTGPDRELEFTLELIRRNLPPAKTEK